MNIMSIICNVSNDSEHSIPDYNTEYANMYVINIISNMSHIPFKRKFWSEGAKCHEIIKDAAINV